MKKFFTNLKQQFSELDTLERLIFVTCCVGIFLLSIVASYLMLDIFL